MSLIRKHGAVLQAWACLDLVPSYRHVTQMWTSGIVTNCVEAMKIVKSLKYVLFMH